MKMKGSAESSRNVKFKPSVLSIERDKANAARVYAHSVCQLFTAWLINSANSINV